MGLTMEAIKIESLEDIFRHSRGEIEGQEIRTIEVEALVDTGAHYLALHRKHIDRLGLQFMHTRMIRTVGKTTAMGIYNGIVYTLLGRPGTGHVVEIPEDTMPLIGVLVLEDLDLLVDPKSQRLIPRDPEQHVNLL